MNKAIAPALALALGIAAAPAVRAATITVNSTADTTGGVPCTLRDAILAANTNAVSGGCVAGGATDVIAFAIPVATDPGCNAGTGVCVIKPLTQTPFITGLVDINGFTQPGASANTLPGGAYPNAQGLDTQIRIELDGSLQPAGTTGLVFNAGSTGSRVRGLAILNFNTQMILNVGTLVTGNYVGTRADGVTKGTQTFGVSGNGASSIGTALAADRNLITGADVNVFVNGGNSTTIEGNLIGTDRTGTVSLSVGTGIQIRGTTGPAFGHVIANNVISGNGGFGIELLGTSNAGVSGNAIGVAVGGAALGNGRGMLIADNAAGTSTITVLTGNAIANSTFADGLIVLDAAATAGFPNSVNVDGTNRFWNNAGLGINLAPQSEMGAAIVSLNDALDADAGPNNVQNYPVITSAIKNANGSISISFTLDSLPNGTFGINAWANDDCSAASAREGRYPSGQISPNVSTDAAGHVAGVFTIPNPPPAGWVVGAGISMTARDTGAAAVSEFSACVAVANAVPVELQSFDAE